MRAYPCALVLVLLSVPAAAEDLSADTQKAACLAAHKDEYRSPYELYPPAWLTYCEKGIKPADIVALGKKWCREQYDAEQAAPLKIDEKAWAAACEKGLDGKTPYGYLSAKKAERLAGLSPAEMTDPEARQYLKDTEKSKDSAVLAKRKEVGERLARFEELRKKFGAGLEKSQWAKLPLSVARGDAAAGFEKAKALFDGGGTAKGFAGAPTVAGGGSFAGKTSDSRPLKLAQSMKGVDKGYAAPAKTIARMRDTVASLAKRVNEKGSALHDPKTIRLLGLLIDSVDPADPQGLEDVSAAVGALDAGTKVVWDKKLKGYAVAHKNEDGTYTLTVRPTDDHGSSYHDIQMAGTLLHETSHAWLWSQGGGVNDLLNEGLAHEREFRYYARAAQSLDLKIKAEEAAFAAAGSDKEREKRLKKLSDLKIERTTSFLDSDNRRWLADFESDPRKFRRDLVGRYYGEDEQIEPGQVTLDQEKAVTEKNLAAANTAYAKAKTGRSWLRARLDLPSAAENEAKKDVASVKKRQERLLIDEKQEAQRLKADKAWRKAQQKKCAEFTASDPTYVSLQGSRAMYEKRSANPKTKKKTREEAEKMILIIEDNLWELEQGYGPCRVSP